MSIRQLEEERWELKGRLLDCRSELRELQNVLPIIESSLHQNDFEQQTAVLKKKEKLRSCREKISSLDRLIKDKNSEIESLEIELENDTRLWQKDHQKHKAGLDKATQNFPFPQTSLYANELMLLEHDRDCYHKKWEAMENSLPDDPLDAYQRQHLQKELMFKHTQLLESYCK